MNTKIEIKKNKSGGKDLHFTFDWSEDDEHILEFLKEFTGCYFEIDGKLLTDTEYNDANKDVLCYGCIDRCLETKTFILYNCGINLNYWTMRVLI